MTHAYEKMIGSLIGLARAAYSAPRTSELYQVLTDGLCAADTANEAELHALTEKAAVLKHQASPNCAVCANPCGRTDDYDFSRIGNAVPAIRDQKTALLAHLCALAHLYRQTDEAADARREAEEFFPEGLFILGEDYDAETISLYVKKAAVIAAKLS